MRIWKYILVTIFTMVTWAGLAFFATTSGWTHAPIAPDTFSRSFIGATDQELRKQFVGQLAMAAFRKGHVECEKFYTAGKPVDRNTVFQVSSLSKWILSFGIMKLVEEGKLDLDAPVRKYLTRWKSSPGKFNNEDVTARRLLSHTAGITDGLGYSGYETAIPVQSIGQPLTHAADADAFIYPDESYTLLQLVVEEVSGQSFASYMKATIFDPLQMIHSTYQWNDSLIYTLADLYNSDGTPSTYRQYTALAATSLYTSLSDLELFVQAHLPGNNPHDPVGRNIIKPETIQMMRQPHGEKWGIYKWGLGTILYATTDSGDYIMGYDGKSSPPINTSVRLNPDTGDGIIILETGHPALATKLASEWVFWKTGKVDTFLFPMLIDKLLLIIGIGWLVIVTVATALFRIRR